MATHTSTIQEQRWWSQQAKFTGMNGNFVAFLGEILKEMDAQKRKLRETSRAYKVIERSFRYIELIYNRSLSTAKDIQGCIKVQEYREIIRKIPLPAKPGFEKSKKPKIKVTRINDEGKEYEVDIDSDLEDEIPTDVPGFPKGWFVSEGEREVSQYIKNVLESAVCGAALEVILMQGLSRDRNGFDTIEKLAEVFGRNAAHIAMLPMQFEWGNPERTLAQDWTEYKLQLDGSEYLRLHSNNEPLMVNSAMTGFEKYQNSFRLIDHIRTSEGENASWVKFKKAVDRFLGDSHRYQFQRAIMNNDNGLAAMTTAAVTIPEDGEYINYVHNQFKSKGSKKKGKGKGKNKNKPANKNPSTHPSDLAAKPKNEKNKNSVDKKCAWCGDKSHFSHQCKSHGDGKWDEKQCNRCKGYGHPQAACINPAKKDKAPKQT